jgi:hypothetical protein
MHFHIARTASTTGNLLQTLVNEQLTGNTDGMHVCYGVGTSGVNTLNNNCSRYSKLEQARMLQEGLGPGALTVYDTAEAAENGIRNSGVLFARDFVHSRGRDIRPILEPWQIRPLFERGNVFFTGFVPSTREFRVWTYRQRHLGTYEKLLRRPASCKKLGRNYDNGFDFSGIDNDEVPQGLKDISRSAIGALNLDFGAVDILQRPDGSYCVLEVNSAPGVSNERRKVIQALAHRIVRWAANGCPARANVGNQ